MTKITPLCFAAFLVFLSGCQPSSSASSKIPSASSNHEWSNEELITVEGYDGNAMEIGISADDAYLLFNDKQKPNKDMHWASRMDDRTYRYEGKVKNTVSPTVDGTPSFDGGDTLYFTTLKTMPQDGKSMYKARFVDGVAIDLTPIEGDIYVLGENKPGKRWISLDPDISDDGMSLYYSEGYFSGGMFPHPFNVRGATLTNGRFMKMDDAILAHVNTDDLEYAPAISADGLELYFTRVDAKALNPLGIFVAKRTSKTEPFGMPEKIEAITGLVEAPVLSGDEKSLYYHRMHRGKFRVFRVTRE